MANKKITDLSAASVPLAGTELFETVQGGVSLKVEASDIAAAFTTDAANILPVANGGTGAATLTGYVKSAGTSAMTAAATIPFADLAGRAYGSFCDVTDQTGNTGTPTAVKFGTDIIASAGITVVTDGSALTRITFAAAGTYLVSYSLQAANSDAADQDVTVWLRLNGTDITNTGRKSSVPKTGDGGAMTLQGSYTVVATAGQYAQVMWVPENVAVTLDHTAAAAGPPAIPAIPASYVWAERIA